MLIVNQQCVPCIVRRVFNAVMEGFSVDVEYQRIRRTRYDLRTSRTDVDARRNALQQVIVSM